MAYLSGKLQDKEAGNSQQLTVTSGYVSQEWVERICDELVSRYGGEIYRHLVRLIEPAS